MSINISILAEKLFMREANGIHTAVRQLQQQLQAREDVRLLQEPSPAADVIHAHTVGARYLLTALARRERLVVSAHVTPETCLGGVRFDRWCRLFTAPYLRFAYSRARVVIAVSPPVAERLKEIGVQAEIVELCNSVDRELFRPDPRWREKRPELGLTEQDFVVLSVGQVQPRKGIWSFVRVAKLLPEYHFVWVGGRPFGRVTAGYEAISDLLENPPANVIFTGPVPLGDMPQYYGLADAFFFPSYQECFGYAVLEAAAMGLPLLLRDTPEYAAYFFEHYLTAGNDEAFAARLRELAGDAGQRAHWQEEALALAERYTVENYIDRLIAVYRQVAGRNN